MKGLLVAITSRRWKTLLFLAVVSNIIWSVCSPPPRPEHLVKVAVLRGQNIPCGAAMPHLQHT